jgi:hypothetical protein
MGVFNKDLSETLIGHLIFHWIFPMGAIIYGITGICRQSIYVRRAPVEGVAAILYGAGFVLAGLAITGMPSLAKLQSGGFNMSFRIRLALMLAAAGLFLSAVLFIS